MGGAIGVAVVGTVFDRLEHGSFTASFKHATPVGIALFLAAAVLALALPKTAVGDEELAEL